MHRGDAEAQRKGGGVIDEPFRAFLEGLSVRPFDTGGTLVPTPLVPRRRRVFAVSSYFFLKNPNGDSTRTTTDFAAWLPEVASGGYDNTLHVHAFFAAVALRSLAPSTKVT